jgi:hypothetical protein
VVVVVFFAVVAGVAAVDRVAVEEIQATQLGGGQYAGVACTDPGTDLRSWQCRLSRL